MARGNFGRAVVPIIDPETNCVTGWALQVVGDGLGGGSEFTTDLSVIHEGGGRMLFTTLTPVTDIAIGTIVPDDPDDLVDVKQHIHIDAIVIVNGIASAYDSFDLVQGGTMTHDVVASSTWRFTLDANGSVTVQRVVGFDTGRVVVSAMWW